MTTPALSAQANAVTHSVLVVRATDRASIVITGKDRTSWLNGLVTCDLTKLEVGRAAWGLLVEKKGRIETDLLALPGADALVLAVPQELRNQTVETLDHYLIMEDAELTPEDLTLFYAYGPRAADLAGEKIGAYSGTMDPFGTGGAFLAGVDEDKLRERVAALGGVFGDEASLEAIRIERGVPRFGVEFDATMYPQEAGIEKQTVAFDKGCYLGQEVVYMLENRGHVKRKLVSLDIEGEGALEKGAIVKTPDGAEIGDIRSSVMGPTSHRAVAIAMVKFAQSKPDTELRIGDRIAKVRAADRA